MIKSTTPTAQASSTLYQNLAGKITGLIEHGTLRPGERVPSVRALSRQNRVSIATAIHAYRELENKGLIEARPQSGFFVRPRVLRQPSEPARSSPPLRPTKLENYESVRRYYLRMADDASLINFGLALPDASLLPTRHLSRAMASLARRSPTLANVYDVAPGNFLLRAQIARRLMEAGCALSPDDLVITSGCQEALSLALRAVARSGDTIAIESPAYFGVLGLLESLEMKVCEIPTFPGDGVCLDELAARLDRCRVKACLFMLNFSNPLGSCMPDEKKARLVALLAKRGIPLIEDDIFGELTFQTSRPKAAKAYDTTGAVLYCSSFCKSLAPGFRIGWIAPGKFRDRVEQLKRVTTVGNPTLPQLAVAEFLANGGFDHHLRRLRRTFAETVKQVSHALVRYFPEGTRATRPAGGFVLWVELPGGVDSVQLFERALAEKIAIAPGPIFAPEARYKNFIRLSCGHVWSETLDRALLRLGRLVSNMSG